MGGLHSRGSNRSLRIYHNAHEVAPVTVIRYRLLESARSRWKHYIRCSFQAQQRRAHQQEKRHKCRNWISWKAEKKLAAAPTEHKRFPWLDRDPPKVKLATEFSESALHEVKFAH
jgi:hypothetical protein